MKTQLKIHLNKNTTLEFDAKKFKLGKIYDDKKIFTIIKIVDKNTSKPLPYSTISDVYNFNGELLLENVADFTYSTFKNRWVYKKVENNVWKNKYIPYTKAGVVNGK